MSAKEYKVYNPVRFLLNRAVDDADKPKTTEAPVDAPAFSLTKVSALIGTLLGPAVAAIAKAFTDQKFTTAQYTAMFIGLVGFLGLITAADVISRAVATTSVNHLKAAKATASAEVEQAKHVAEISAKALTEVADAEAKATVAARDHVLNFASPVSGRLVSTGKDPAISILAFGSGGDGRFLIKDDEDKLSWVPLTKVSFGD